MPLPRPSRPLQVRDVENEGRHLGLGRNPGSVAFKRRFMAMFGVSPFIVCLLWNLLDPRSHHAFPSNVALKHLLWALCFLKTYTTDKVLQLLLREPSGDGGPNEKTLRKWVWLFVTEICALYGYLVRNPQR